MMKDEPVFPVDTMKSSKKLLMQFPRGTFKSKVAKTFGALLTRATILSTLLPPPIVSTAENWRETTFDSSRRVSAWTDLSEEERA